MLYIEQLSSVVIETCKNSLGRISLRVLCHTYDLKEQLLTATQGSGEKASTSSYTYDSVGNVTLVTNVNGKVTSYSYDHLFNLMERMTSLGDKEIYTYNVNNQLEKLTY